MKRITLRTVLLNSGLAAVTAIWLWPVLFMYATSIKTERNIALTIGLFTNEPTFMHYMRVLTTAELPRWFYNSFIVTAVTTGLVLITSSMAAYAFARIRFPGRNKLFIVVIATLMVPQQVLLVPQYVMMAELGWINTYAAMIMPRVGLALGVFMLRQFFLGLPKELEEAALIDGATRLGIFVRIVIPLAKPALSALTIFTVLGSWNDFLWPMVVTSKSKMFTITVGLANFTGTYGFEYGSWMAAAVMASTPVLVVFLILQRHFVRGLTMTGIKG